MCRRPINVHIEPLQAGPPPPPPSHHPLCAIALSGPHPSSDWHRQSSEMGPVEKSQRLLERYNFERSFYMQAIRSDAHILIGESADRIAEYT
ncbi:hypothetical protein EYF80_009530 [Liparis tanakae]|uniref:Uncharacterized protein n=1 Tax=Liparis tanakae TaxID=230148 RepID=A0A4Z2IQL5_9TELE|nr:hypothetical protein EYF80_009530 [Liparis tanakae]